MQDTTETFEISQRSLTGDDPEGQITLDGDVIRGGGEE